VVQRRLETVPGSALRGWLLDASTPTLALEAPDGGLSLVDSQGVTLGRIDGAPADALRRRLAEGPGAPLPPTLVATLAHLPALARALERPALALDAPTLLRRGRWQQLFVELTAACNERCAHCYASASPERREALDRPTAEAVVRDAAALGFEVVQFTGGEALLCSFLGDLCQQARDAGVPIVEVYTNGVLLTPERYAPLRAAGAAFALSLYARDPEVHDRVTALKGSHARTVAAIRRALEGGSPVRVGVIATRAEDEAEAVAAADLARELGVPQADVRLEVARAVGRGTFAGRAVPDDGHGGGPTHGHAPPTFDRAPGGKAAVLPDGWVVPCIFSRELRLGRVGPAGGLRAALEAPAARVVDAASEPGARRALGDLTAQLTCGECRLVKALLCAP
jgi:MoaA/NifB/PqqE/SkfB family radical SAM enzyme